MRVIEKVIDGVKYLTLDEISEINNEQLKNILVNIESVFRQRDKLLAEKEQIIRTLEQMKSGEIQPYAFETEREEEWYDCGVDEGLGKAIEIVKGGGKE